MTKRKMPTPKLSAREVMQGKHYPGIKGKAVLWADHAFEEGAPSSQTQNNRE
jgi:hypothetical protein